MEDYNEPTETTSKTAKINAAGLINIQIEELFKEGSKYHRKGRYLSWNSALDDIWIILGGEPDTIGTQDKPSEVETELNKIEKELQAYYPLKDSIEIIGFGSITDKQLEKINKINLLLIKKARFLRALQYKQGKGTAYEDQSADYMDE